MILDLRADDCIEGMDELPPKSVDVCVTSPPYNLGVKYQSYNDRQKHDVYLNWTKHWVSAVQRVLKDDGSFFLNLGGSPRQPYLPHQILLVVKDIFVLQNTFHWIKAISVGMRDGTDLSVGHFKPINSDRFVNDCHEFVFHLTKTGEVPVDRLALGVPYMDKSNVRRWSHTGGRDKRCRGNVWFIPYTTIQSRKKQRPHPATFPPMLAENAIRIHGKENAAVLDPFVGIGNAAIGALHAKAASFIGLDIDPGYIADAAVLIEEERKSGRSDSVLLDMRILVTGGAGFIGSHIVEHFQEKADVVVFDNLRTGSRSNISPFKCEFVFGSILNRIAVRKAMVGVDYVFHLAGMVSVAESMADPVTCTEINTLGTLIVLEEAAHAGVKKLAFSSSAAVYGDGMPLPRAESGQMEPKSPYAATKLAGEVHCQMFTLERKLPTVSLRYFNVFGPRQAGNSRYGAIPMFISNALKGIPIKVHGDGRQTRDFIYVKDLVAATVFLATLPEAIGSFNVGTGSGTPIGELAERIVSLSGSTSKIVEAPERIGDIRYSVADISKLKAAGYSPTTNLLEGLKTTISSLTRS